jgi:low affinity Fe/Cu permease
MSRSNAFSRFASKAASAAGHPTVFAGAIAIIVAWGALGPAARYSDTWQLVINTSTTIITFLMVFIIQNTQNRDGKATQIKLDEIIRALHGAHNALLDLEELSEEDLQRIRERYIEIAKRAREDVAAGLKDTDEPDVTLGEAIADELTEPESL